MERRRLHHVDLRTDGASVLAYSGTQVLRSRPLGAQRVRGRYSRRRSTSRSFPQHFDNPGVSCAAGLSLRLAAIAEGGADILVAHQSALLLETDLQLVHHGPVGVAEGFETRLASSPPEDESHGNGKQATTNLSSESRGTLTGSGLDRETKIFSPSGRRGNFFLDIPFYRTH